MGLWACVAERWAPEIGDPNVTGWVTVAVYLVTALLAAAVWRGTGVGRGRAFWAVLTLILGFLALNKQLDLQTALTEVGRCLAWSQGWYENRRFVQAGFIGALLVLLVMGLFSAMQALRGNLRRNLLALLGLTVLLGFVMVRAVSIHDFDFLISDRSLGVPNNFLFENAGLVLIAVNALLLLLRRRHRTRQRRLA
ncbi:hypothetical protein [Paracoccus sp. T5]|uniref:hypothetical protein n=1 Tax=Paracoccus sp. T5 TaxID=3402161 RepID=UPI003AE5B9C1